MYMVAEKGSTSPIKVSSIRFYEDLTDFFNEQTIHYVDQILEDKRTQRRTGFKSTFLNFLIRFGPFIVYECKPSSPTRGAVVGKYKRPENLLKNEVSTRALLVKHGFDPDA